MCRKKIFNYIVIIGILSFIVLAATLSSSINADDYVDPTIFGGGVSSSSSSSSSSSTFNSGNTDIDIIINSLFYGSSSSTSSSSSSGGSVGTCKVEPGTERYCKDCGPCEEGQGMCFINSDCKSGLVCNSSGVCERSLGAGCRLPEGYEGYCDPLVCGPCSEGQSRCRKKDDCIGDLVCNSKGYCVRPSNPSSSSSGGGCRLTPPKHGYCDPLVCGPCKEGEGWCENDSECISGLVCNRDGICVRSSNPSNSSGGCRLTPPTWTYCVACGPCKEGEGWCDGDKDCAIGLVCSQNNYCVRPSNQPSGSDGCRLQEGTLTYCAVCGPCSEGQSVCHKDIQCASGLICNSNGFCVRPSIPSNDNNNNNNNNNCQVPVGSATYCADCGPCREGQGKCSKDTDCIKGLVCSEHTGLCKKP